jgi:hypothetical protein
MRGPWDTTGYGGGIWNHGTLTVSDCYISDNKADWGGAIFNSSGSVTVTDSSEITENRATLRGGGLCNNTGASMDVGGSAQITSNTVGEFGGGIYNQGDLIVTSCVLDGNETDTGVGVGQQGGGIYFDGGDNVSVSDVTIRNNVAGTQGGGFFMASGTVQLTNVTIQNNQCGTADNRVGTVGGGFYAEAGDLIVNDGCTLSGNVAETAPGGAYVSSDTCFTGSFSGQPVIPL